jgi:glycosyltransferase involved in cell wall biosynthesis
MNKATLGIIVPLSSMSGKLHILKSWLNVCSEMPQIYIYIVHDKKDELTGPELKLMLEDLQNSRITIIESEAGGPGAARNLGLRKASEDWVIFWDSDDYGYVREIPELLERNSSREVIICNFEVTDFQENQVFTVRHGNDWAKVAKSPGVWRFIFKREFLTDKEFPKFSMGEDQLFLESLAIPNSNYEFSETVLYRYSKNRPSSLTARRDVSDLRKVIQKGFFMSKNQHPQSQKFTKKLLLRQCISLFKYGNTPEKTFAIRYSLLIASRFSI